MSTTYRQPVRFATYRLPLAADPNELLGQVVGPNTLGERFVIVDVEPSDPPEGDDRRAVLAGMAYATVHDLEAAGRA